MFHESHRPSIRSLWVASIAIAWSLVAAQSSLLAADRLPNVVMILADDLGWSDTSLYGTTDFYRTPNVQRLAERGMTFTRAYSASPLCSPTRASILTGMSPARHGITAPQCHTPKVRLNATLKGRAAPNQKSIQPDSITRLNPKTVTIADSLKAAGYVTGHFGKWHLGPDPYSPLQHGFDVDIPHWHGPGPAGSYVAPWKFPDFDHDPDVPDQHIEDRMANEAVAFLRTHQDKPFFLNYWMFSVHAPFDAKKKLIDKYSQVVDPQDEQRCPTYAAMIESMDDAVGTLLDELDRLGLTDNTIIVFASDNGGNTYSLVGDEHPTSNRPLRGGKATMYEGGVRTPAIVIWPNQCDAGVTSDVVIQSMDFFPTLVEMLGLESRQEQTFDGVSLVPVLKGLSIARNAIFTYFPHNPPVPDWLPPSISVHSGRWKLIRIFHGGENGAHRYKLFDLEKDLGERDDLSAQHSERVRELDALIDAHLQATSAVVPVINPAFDPARYDPFEEGKPAAKFVVARWRSGGTCGVSLVDHCLRVLSTGGDPHLSFRMAKPVDAGAYTLKIRMRSDSGGSGQIFWSKAGKRFAADRSVRFKPVHDRMEHEYAVRFLTDEPMQSLRVDPSTNAGIIDIIELQLLQGDKRVRSWRF